MKEITPLIWASFTNKAYTLKSQNTAFFDGLLIKSAILYQVS